MSEPTLRDLIEELFQGLDVLPYHLFLGVSAEADGDTLRDAFHHRAQELHPDLFYTSGDTELRERAYAVYKRITEAYRVLSDPIRRADYQEQRVKGITRYDSARRKKQTGGDAHLDVKPAAHKYYRMAMTAQKQGDKRGAKLHLKLALQFDRNNDGLKELLEKLS